MGLTGSDRKDTGTKAFGDRVKALMKKAGISQKEMAARVGISQPNISQLWAGATRLSEESREAIAKELGISKAELEGDTLKSQHPVAPLPSVNPRRPEPQDPELPPGLAEYLAAHAEDRRITKRELHALETLRFHSEPWVIYDTAFWDAQLKTWRDLFEREHDAVAAPVQPKGH